MRNKADKEGFEFIALVDELASREPRVTTLKSMNQASLYETQGRLWKSDTMTCGAQATVTYAFVPNYGSKKGEVNQAMGDKSPKSTQKQASQKKVKDDTDQQKKTDAQSAKQADTSAKTAKK